MRQSIANPYEMEQVPKIRTPISSHVNGKRARCHNCGWARVRTIESAHIGKADHQLDKCDRCNSVIQRAPKIKTGNRYGLAPAEAVVLDLLASKLGHCVPYAELQAAASAEQETLFVYVANIRRKVPNLKISTKTRGGYTLEFWIRDEPQDTIDPQYRWYCEQGHEWKDASRFDEVMTEHGLKPACPACGLEVVQAEKS